MELEDKALSASSALRYHRAAMRTVRLTRALAVALSLAYLIQLVVLVSLRVQFPYSLEWMEGAMIDHVQWVMDGNALYAEPTIRFTAFIYAPLFIYVAAGLTWLLGPGFLPLRLVSIAATLVSFAVIFDLARRESRSVLAGVLAVGLFAACFEISGSWLDIGRVDSLRLGFLLCAVWVMRTDRSPRAAVVSALLFSLAALTKQSAVGVAALMGVYFAWDRGFRPGLAYFATLALGTGGGWLWLHLASEGWSTFYAWILPPAHGMFSVMLLGYWWMDLIVPLTPACAVAVWLIASSGLKARRERGREVGEFLFWFLFLGATVASGWSARLHFGGHTNVIMPAYAAIAVAWGVGVIRLAALAGVRGSALVYAGCAAQLAWLVFDPRPHVPTAELRTANDELVRVIGSYPGEVFVPFHGYLPVMAGKRAYSHQMMLKDVLRSSREAEKDILKADIRRAVRQRQFDAVIIDNLVYTPKWLRRELRRTYDYQGYLFDEGIEAGPVIGTRYNPQLFLPREPAAGDGPRGEWTRSDGSDS